MGEESETSDSSPLFMSTHILFCRMREGRGIFVHHFFFEIPSVFGVRNKTKITIFALRLKVGLFLTQ